MEDWRSPLGRGRLPPFEGLLQVVQGASDLVGKVLALLAKNDVLVIGKREFATSAEALPQKHRRDMFNGSGASHTSFDASVSVSNTLLIKS
jgi:hypothetical protein